LRIARRVMDRSIDGRANPGCVACRGLHWPRRTGACGRGPVSSHAFVARPPRYGHTVPSLLGRHVNCRKARGKRLPGRISKRRAAPSQPPRSPKRPQTMLSRYRGYVLIAPTNQI
jgi:hypothetical protein